MDGLTMRRLAVELGQELIGSKIEKIYQPSERDLVFNLRPLGRPTVRMLVSAHKQFARIHLLENERPENPKEPPMFCMLLRKYIEGGRIVSIDQHEWDRVISFTVEAIDEVGDLKTYYLVCEIMGRHSNVILCRRDPSGDRRIIDSIVRVTENMSRVREVLPGAPYLAPPAQNKRAFENLTPEDLGGVDSRAWMSKSNVQYVLDQVAGVGPISVREALYRASQMPTADSPTGSDATDLASDDANVRVYRALSVMMEALNGQREEASVSLDAVGRATECAPFHLTHRDSYAVCPSMSAAIRRRFADNGKVLYHSHLQDDLRRTVTDHLDKLRGKQVKLQESLADSKEESIYRLKAELLTAYAHQIQKGETTCVLANYYEDNEPIAIDLDPALDAIANAQRYFKQATKRKRAATMVAEQLERTELDIRYLEEVSESLHDASVENLEQIKRELVQQGFFHEKVAKKKGKTNPTRPPKVEARPNEFRSKDGFIIRVGRNNLQNDRLTFRQSDGHDVWLHVKDQPGSHVVIKREAATEIPSDTLEEAAILAAYYSRGRDSANVPVDITEIRHVWKPNGARPGLALYDQQRTVFVTPDRSLIEPLLARQREVESVSE